MSFVVISAVQVLALLLLYEFLPVLHISWLDLLLCLVAKRHSLHWVITFSVPGE